MFICDSCLATYDNEVIVGGSCPQRKCEGRLVEIDEHMMPICVNLWEKGYDTKFCCEGHFDKNEFPYLIISIDKDLCPQIPIRFPISTSGRDVMENISISYWNRYDNHICLQDIDNNNVSDNDLLIFRRFDNAIHDIMKITDKMKYFETVRDIRFYIKKEQSVDIHIGLRSMHLVTGGFKDISDITPGLYKDMLDYKCRCLSDFMSIVDELPDLNKEET